MHVAGAWLLMLALLFGQGLGAVHAISHGAPRVAGYVHALADTLPAQARAREQAHEQAQDHAHAQAHEQAPRHAHDPAQHPDDTPVLQALFGHAPDEPGCRLYDPLLLAGPLMPVSTVAALPARTRPLPPPSSGVRLAAPAAAYLARGPPRA